MWPHFWRCRAPKSSVARQTHCTRKRLAYLINYFDYVMSACIVLEATGGQIVPLGGSLLSLASRGCVRRRETTERFSRDQGTKPLGVHTQRSRNLPTTGG